MEVLAARNSLSIIEGLSEDPVSAMKDRIGSSACSWGVNFPSDPKQIPWQRFLDELVQADYQWIELGPYGYLPTDPVILYPELQRRNLKAVAGEVMRSLSDAAVWPVLKEEALEVGGMVRIWPMIALGFSSFSTPMPRPASSMRNRSKPFWNRPSRSVFPFASTPATMPIAEETLVLL